MAKKRKTKKGGSKKSFTPSVVNKIENNELMSDAIDESIAHQISIEEILEGRNIVAVSFQKEENEEIKIAPCVILSGADTGINVGTGFDLATGANKLKGKFKSDLKNSFIAFAQRRKSSKKRTSLSPKDMEGFGSGNGNNSNNNNNNGNKNDKKNKKPNKNNSSKKNNNNVVYLKDKINSAKAIKNMPANKILYCIIALIIIIAIIWGATNKNANEVYVGDKAVGVIKDKKITKEKLYNDALAKLKTDKGVNVEVNEEVSLKAVHASKKELVNVDYVLSEICKNFTYQVEAVVIKVDGKEIGTAASKAEAEKILDTVASKYVTEGATIKEKSFTQDVKIENKFVNNDEIESNDAIVTKLTATTTEPREHTVVAGDTLSSIAGGADMSLTELYKANEGLNENSVLQLGQKINLVVPVPVLSVKTVEEVTKEEEFNAEEVVVENNNEYKTYEKVITEGQPGKRKVTSEITKVNGFEESRKDTKTEVITEPVARKVERGTLQTPPKRALGSFIYPVSGRLSSGYGARWGRTHKGIDLACSKGTPIYASDGGTVEFSGWNSGGYGNLIIINHGNGYSTYYGHNSQNVVSAGEKVYQGQLIGYVGSTGDSTGNHVHFEIRSGGTAKNPLNYLG